MKKTGMSVRMFPAGPTGFFCVKESVCQQMPKKYVSRSFLVLTSLDSTFALDDVAQHVLHFELRCTHLLRNEAGGRHTGRGVDFE